ncbi:hypothetical protein [Pedobacter panaciterrae]
MREHITIEIPDSLFNSVINKKVDTFIKWHLDPTNLANEANLIIKIPKSVAARVMDALDEIGSDTYKVRFLTYLLNHLTKLLAQIDNGTFGDGLISNLTKIYSTKPLVEEFIFVVAQDLESRGINLNSNVFSTDEYTEVSFLLKKILEELDVIKAGNSVLGDLVEELQDDLKEVKSSMVLGKKPFYQRLAGIITSYGLTKGGDEFYDQIRPLLVELFKSIKDENYLDSINKLLE